MADSALPKVGELLDFLNKGISPYWDAACSERVQVAAQLKVQQQESDEQKRQIRQLNEENKDLKKNLDDTKLRLSRYMGMQMTNNNPNIADLSDENRPTKIAEMYNELYDNTWTDAYECLVKLGRDERRAIEILRDILITTRKYCDRIGDPLMANLREALFMKEGEPVPDFVLKLFKDNRRTNPDQCLETEYKQFLNKVKNSVSEPWVSARRHVPEYTEECFKISYLMSIQDPPVVFDTTPAESMDTTRYRLFTVKGDNIDYIVWPCVLLNDGGAVLSKGVVQCIKSDARASRVKSAPPRTSPTDQSTVASRHVLQSGNTVRQAWVDESRTVTLNPQAGAIEMGTKTNETFEDDFGRLVDIEQTHDRNRNTTKEKKTGTLPISNRHSLGQTSPYMVTGRNISEPGSYSQQTVDGSFDDKNQAFDRQSGLGASSRVRTLGHGAGAGVPSNADRLYLQFQPTVYQMNAFNMYLCTYGERDAREYFKEDFDMYMYFLDSSA